MRFNAKLDNGAELRWIRPLHSIVLLLDGKVVPFEIAGIKAGKETRGHRFLGNEPFKVTGFADYEKQLEAAQGRARFRHACGEHQRGRARAGQGRAPDAGRGRCARRRERRPHRMADRAHGRVRQVVPRRAGRVPDDVDEDASEMLLAAPRQEAVEPLPAGHQPQGQGRRQDHRRRQREGHRRALVRRQVLLGAGSQEEAGDHARRAEGHHLPRKARHAVRARRARQGAGPADRNLAGAVRGGAGAARRRAGQGRPRLGHGRRVPRAAGPHGPLLRRSRAHEPGHRARHRAALQAEGSDGFSAAGERRRRRRGRRGAGRQARHAGRLLGHRREADRLRRSLPAPPRRVRRHPPRPRERPAPAARRRDRDDD